MFALYQVAPHLVPRFWPLVKDHVTEALRRCNADDTEQHLRFRCTTGRTQLWVIVEDKKVIASGTTEILITNAGGKLLQIATLGGSRMDEWVHLWPQIEDYARIEGCQKIRFQGRRGWSKVLKDYHQPWLVLEKSL